MNVDTPPTDDRQGIQVIARAAAILRAVEGEPSGLSLGELAGRLGLARSTVQRIVSALTEEGFLMSAGPRAGVTLGPAIIRLAAAAIIDTERMVHPVIQSLSNAIGETVDLSILRRDSAVFVDQVTGKSRLVAISAIGEAFPLYCTANGKALLSLLSKDRRERLLDKRLPRLTPQTITHRSQLWDEIADVQKTGLAWDNEEHAPGISAVGIAFVDPVGRHFAVSVPVPSTRFHAKRDELGRAVLRAKVDILKLFPATAEPSRGS